MWGPLTPINESPSRKEFNAQLHRASLGRILPVSVGKLQRRVLLRDFELPEHFPMHRVSGWTIFRVVSIEQLPFMHLLQQRLLLPQWCGLPAPATFLLFWHGVLNSCPRPVSSDAAHVRLIIVFFVDAGSTSIRTCPGGYYCPSGE